jgi:aldose 1-epimerase
MQNMIGTLAILIAGIVAIVLVGCLSVHESMLGRITKEPFGRLKDGTLVDLYTLRNPNGIEVKISNYGGTVVSIIMPDRLGLPGDVVLGFDKLDDYLTNSPFFGAIVGRYGNRIAKAKFTLEGSTYTLATNNGPNSLHGGIRGFDKVLWQARHFTSHDGQALELKYVSKDGEEGFPGTLSVTALYTLTPANELRLEFTATTDKATVANLTQHSYFNLAGKGDILNHVLFLNADKFTPVDSTLIPTGELRSVAGTPFDFRQPTAIGARINDNDEQLKLAGGYDHNFVVNNPPGKLGLVARATDPASGRVLEVFSTQPGVQFYTGNFLSGTLTGKGGWVYQRRAGFCLEAQHFPDSPNQANFPSVVLKPGEVYRNTIIFKFSTN